MSRGEAPACETDAQIVIEPALKCGIDRRQVSRVAALQVPPARRNSAPSWPDVRHSKHRRCSSNRGAFVQSMERIEARLSNPGATAKFLSETEQRSDAPDRMDARCVESLFFTEHF